MGTQDKARTWTPSGSTTISCTIFSVSTGYVGLIERVIVRDVVKVLWDGLALSSTVIRDESTTYLTSYHHADLVFLNTMGEKGAEDSKCRYHICIENADPVEVEANGGDK